MSFHDRNAIARPHEEAVARALRVRGWDVTDIGTAWLPEVSRDLLRSIDTPLRNMPDLLALRQRDGLFVDAKAGRTDTKFYDIEQRVLDSAHAWDHLLPVVFVWSDMQCSTSEELWHLDLEGALKPGTFAGKGSGTPFWLVPKNHARALDDIFGPVLAVAS